MTTLRGSIPSTGIRVPLTWAAVAFALQAFAIFGSQAVTYGSLSNQVKELKENGSPRLQQHIERDADFRETILQRLSKLESRQTSNTEILNRIDQHLEKLR